MVSPHELGGQGQQRDTMATHPEKIRIELCSLGLAPKELCPKKHVPVIIHIPEKELEKTRSRPQQVNNTRKENPRKTCEENTYH